MASVTPCKNTRNFFESGTTQQFEWILKQYDQCLRIKAEHKSQRPENVIKLDKWYQNELPKKIKSRGKDAHLVHEEMVQTIKWKLARGKFFPQLTNLVKINTPKAVQTETRKAFRKMPNLEQAATNLTNLKGVGTTMASAVLAAGAPHIAPFMADEILLALPEVDCLEYTMKEYMRMVEHVNACVERLNAQGGNWTPHTVELAIWTYYIANDLKPEILEGMPSAKATSADSKDKADNGNGAEEKKEEDETAVPAANGAAANEDSNLSAAGTAEDSNMSAPSTGDDEDSSNAAAASNGKEEAAATSSAASSTPSSQEASPKSSDAATEPEKTNGNNGSESAPAAKENGSSSTPAPESSSTSTSSSSSAAEAAAAPTSTSTTPSKSSVIQTEENTSDSTKENQEATSGGASAAVKRPAEANDDNAQEASPAGEATENTDASAAEPVAKKLKSDEEAPTVPAV